MREWPVENVVDPPPPPSRAPRGAWLLKKGCICIFGQPLVLHMRLGELAAANDIV